MTIGSVLAFLLSRYFFQAHFLRMVERRPAWRAIVDAVDSQGWQLVFLLRLGAPVPGAVTNYLLGLSRIGLWPYGAATLVGLVPQTVLYMYFGTLGHVALTDLFTAPLRFAAFAAGSIVMLVCVLLISARARAILAQSRATASPLPRVTISH
jgi:uncharacterized membrane protein YdjX (TVP38/TMEM64 family)